MPSLASGNSSCTACASTCAVECRSTARPSSVSIGTDSTTSPSSGTQARSRSASPLARATTASTPRSWKTRPIVVPAAATRGLPSTVRRMSVMRPRLASGRRGARRVIACSGAGREGRGRAGYNDAVSRRLEPTDDEPTQQIRRSPAPGGPRLPDGLDPSGGRALRTREGQDGSGPDGAGVSSTEVLSLDELMDVAAIPPSAPPRPQTQRPAPAQPPGPTAQGQARAAAAAAAAAGPAPTPAAAYQPH